ncbi:chitin deacetylase 8 [Nematostella vectensis]|uniref:chitin deacetylase 8 n=1 Tax=Nematostella vectensis TaxID=45351 RepID=UPI00207731B3|nr:chitin deacetylase 8 [Nematostella vectensis]
MSQRLLTAFLFLATVPGFQGKSYSNVAEKCDLEKCQPPNCRCSDDFQPPGGLSPALTPQIIMITFDDDITVINYEQYKDAVKGFTNPNGCPITATFFISHNYTNYYLAEKLHSEGHELADHTVTHRTPTTYWEDATYEEWESEITGEREILHKLTGLPSSTIKGFRAPFLEITEHQYQALYTNNFTYDLSWPTGRYYNPPMYPYTLDYRSIQDCPVGKCPVMSYPGLWVVPNIDLMDGNGNVCGAMMDACNPTGNSTQWYETMLLNFQYHYHSNKAPFGLHAHSAWFSQSTGHMEALRKFLTLVASRDDVWVLTVSQVIEWMKNPQDVNGANGFPAWDCLTRPKPRCSTPNVCHYTTPQDFYMPTCSDCPKHFPSPTNPDGE